MRLHDDNAELELWIIGYQFENQETDGDVVAPTSWDSNWLVIAGSVRTSDGTSWSFQDPSLTTWEVAQLACWLERIVPAAKTEVVSLDEATATERADVDVDEQVIEQLTFTEPSLSFAVGRQQGSQIELMIGLNNEAAAPHLDPQSPKRSQITLVVSKQQIQDAAVAVRNQLITSPVR